jgi:hypothetical protein
MVALIALGAAALMVLVVMVVLAATGDDPHWIERRL